MTILGIALIVGLLSSADSAKGETLDHIVIEAPALSTKLGSFYTKSNQKVEIGGGGYGLRLGYAHDIFTFSTGYSSNELEYRVENYENVVSQTEFELNGGVRVLLSEFTATHLFIGGISGEMNFKGSSAISQAVKYSGIHLGISFDYFFLSASITKDFLTIKNFNDGNSTSNQAYSPISVWLSIALHEILF